MFVLVLLLGTLNASAAEPITTEDIEAQGTAPRVRPSLAWVLFQALPSPQIISSETGSGRGPNFGMRWQITPVLISWGINRKLSPWRFLVAEPLTRHGGSVEIYYSPEAGRFGRKEGWRLLNRVGTRAYFPLHHSGEYVSFSVGGSYYLLDGRARPSLELGLYVLFGFFGPQITYSPEMEGDGQWAFTLRVRYF